MVGARKNGAAMETREGSGRASKLLLNVACENIRFSSLFAAGDVSRGGNVPGGEERGEMDVFAGYAKCCAGYPQIDWALML